MAVIGMPVAEWDNKLRVLGDSARYPLQRDLTASPVDADYLVEW